MIFAGVAVRLILGAALAWQVTVAATAPEIPLAWRALACVVALAALARPWWGLVVAAAFAPAASLFVPFPARGVELIAWACLSAWLLSVWRPLAPAGWPRAIAIPAVLYSATLVTSWLCIAISGASGISLPALPFYLFHAIPADYLVFSSPEAETWTLLQSLTGLGVFLAAAGIARHDQGVTFRRVLALAVVIAVATLGAASVLELAKEASASGNGVERLLRYLRGDRFSLLADFNAAGSLYVLAAVTAVSLAAFQTRHRLRSATFLLLMLPAIWITGSRSAFLAFVSGLLLLAAVRGRWRPLVQGRKVAVAAVVVVILGAALLADWQSQEQGSAGRAVNLRTQFSATTARMIASAPVFGVGIGHYFDRSAEFMSDELKAIYGSENAHNYFAQQFAELGVGGTFFLWLVIGGLAAGWYAVRGGMGEAAAAGLFAGATAYLMTCLTGHPLLVPEAALPFWIVFGALAFGDTPAWPRLNRVMIPAAALWLVAGITVALVSYTRVAAPATTLPDSGFHGFEFDEGQRFRWMTRHAVTYVPAEPGFMHLMMRGADRPRRRPLIMETSIGGRLLDRREIPSDRWVSYDIAAPAIGSAGYRRVDFRVNQEWQQEVQLGRRRAQRPITVMAAAIEWIPLR